MSGSVIVVVVVVGLEARAIMLLARVVNVVRVEFEVVRFCGRDILLTGFGVEHGREGELIGC